MYADNTPLLISYDCRTGSFTCCTQPTPREREIFQALYAGEAEAAPLRQRVLAAANAAVPQAACIPIHIAGGSYQAGVFTAEPGTSVILVLTDMADSVGCRTAIMDPLTGLMSRESFCQSVELQLRRDPEGASRGDYSVVYIDLHRFKVVNELFGREKGDALLSHIAQVLCRSLSASELSCRVASDHFALFLRTRAGAVEAVLDRLYEALHDFGLPFEITFHAGVYETTSAELSADTMLDRAAMAVSSIKGSYHTNCAWYTADMRSALLSEQEISGLMAAALEERQFSVYYQPQYNHSTGMLVGAEALVRWIHPEKGVVSPGVFVPICEKTGFITELDLYVFREACAFQRKCIAEHWALVPISVNFSRYDVFQPDFVRHLEEIRQEYDVPARYLRVELTESIMIGGMEYVNEVISKLHQCGYIVEMDDFGSGYSSLNVLKDIDLDIIKLDMRFLSQSGHSNKGGTILSSVVRMAKWLNLPVIAEGVETLEQADFLRSIGCEYIQGYLYSKPLPEKDYAALISSSHVGTTVPEMNLIDTMNVCNFWDPNSLETLIFSNYVGAAAIIDYHCGNLELLRVNKKYLQELGMNLSERDLIESNPLLVMDAENQDIYLSMLRRAIETMDEEECTTWQNISSSCCGDERMCIRTSVRVIGVSGDRYLFHAMIRNITAEQLYYESIRSSDHDFRTVTEQANIYFWEYSIATKEMRPCFRCMRDLGLPPVVTNYPEPAIESGIFPPEVADMYRAFMKEIDAGAPSKEAVIPLTLDRIPFHVRYTTEFDENGHPVKAYGSATLVVD